MLQQKPTNLESDAVAASEQAYLAIARETLSPDEVHRLSVCYEATALVVESLVEIGHRAKHELSTGTETPHHSFVVVHTNAGQELIIDPTWQQFLPGSSNRDGLPRVLVGQRSDVINHARSFGVSERNLGVWRAGANSMSVGSQRQRDTDAERAADFADKAGLWDLFSKH